MSDKPRVLISGFADEGPVDKKAEAQLTMLSALGMSYYSLRFVDAGQGVKNVMQLTRREIARLRKLHREFGVQVSSIGSPIIGISANRSAPSTATRWSARAGGCCR